ncbi:MAG: AAA family ATPase [Gammaproteobacteria bacterium]
MKHLPADAEYYLRYGLERDPFPQNTPDEIMFLPPELNHRLELIKHLLEFSQQLLLVIAPDGAGKSSLYRHIAVNADAHWSVSQIIADDGMDANGLTQEAVQSGAWINTDHSAQPINGLNKHLEYCERNQRLPVLVIDDAHKLPIDTLDFIIQLTELKFNETRFRMALFGEEPLVEKLETPRIKASTSGILHTISIPPFTLEQASSYIEYRLLACGRITRYPFNDRDIRRIYKVSGGLPGKINLLARQSLQDPAFRHAQSKLNLNTPGYTVRLFSLVFIFILVLSAYLAFTQQHLQGGTHTVKLTLPLKPPGKSYAAKLPEDESGSKKTYGVMAVEPPSSDAASAPETEAYAEPDSDNGAERLPVLPPYAEAPVPLRISGAAPVRTQQKPAKQDLVAETGSEQVKTAGRTPPVFPGIKGLDWLRQQPAESYVLQLMGAYDQDTIKKFLGEQPTLNDKLAAFSTSNAGKPWYVLVYGIYPNRDVAAAAIDQLPAAIRSEHPWPRPIAGIHRDIEKKP